MKTSYTFIAIVAVTCASTCASIASDAKPTAPYYQRIKGYTTGLSGRITSLGATAKDLFQLPTKKTALQASLIGAAAAGAGTILYLAYKGKLGHRLVKFVQKNPKKSIAVVATIALGIAGYKYGAFDYVAQKIKSLFPAKTSVKAVSKATLPASSALVALGAKADVTGQVNKPDFSSDNTDVLLNTQQPVVVDGLNGNSNITMNDVINDLGPVGVSDALDTSVNTNNTYAQVINSTPALDNAIAQVDSAGNHPMLEDMFDNAMRLFINMRTNASDRLKRVAQHQSEEPTEKESSDNPF